MCSPAAAMVGIQALQTVQQVSAANQEATNTTKSLEQQAKAIKTQNEIRVEQGKQQAQQVANSHMEEGSKVASQLRQKKSALLAQMSEAGVSGNTADRLAMSLENQAADALTGIKNTNTIDQANISNGTAASQSTFKPEVSGINARLSSSVFGSLGKLGGEALNYYASSQATKNALNIPNYKG